MWVEALPGEGEANMIQKRHILVRVEEYVKWTEAKYKDVPWS